MLSSDVSKPICESILLTVPQHGLKAALTCVEITQVTLRNESIHIVFMNRYRQHHEQNQLWSLYSAVASSTKRSSILCCQPLIRRWPQLPRTWAAHVRDPHAFHKKVKAAAAFYAQQCLSPPLSRNHTLHACPENCDTSKSFRKSCGPFHLQAGLVNHSRSKTMAGFPLMKNSPMGDFPVSPDVSKNSLEPQ